MFIFKVRFYNLNEIELKDGTTIHIETSTYEKRSVNIFLNKSIICTKNVEQFTQKISDILYSMYNNPITEDYRLRLEHRLNYFINDPSTIEQYSLKEYQESSNQLDKPSGSYCILHRDPLFDKY